MTQCVYCNRAAVEEVREPCEVNGVRFDHLYTHCSCCDNDFVTPEQDKINEANRSKP
jgi:hypothetical protein